MPDEKKRMILCKIYKMLCRHVNQFTTKMKYLIRNFDESFIIFFLFCTKTVSCFRKTPIRLIRVLNLIYSTFLYTIFSSQTTIINPNADATNLSDCTYPFLFQCLKFPSSFLINLNLSNVIPVFN